MPTTFENFLDMEFRWPTSVDQALRAVPDLSGAEIAQNPFARMVFMADGYKKGADVLVEKATADRALRDVLIYPILFCYRHFIELSLKYVISEYGYLADEPANSKNHDLELLWPIFRKIVTTVGEGDVIALNVVETIVVEFAKIDPGSFSFRYPTNRKGDFIAIGVDNIDLSNLRDTMMGVANYFSGKDGYLHSFRF